MKKTMLAFARFLAGVARQLGLSPRRPFPKPFRIPASGR